MAAIYSTYFGGGGASPGTTVFYTVPNNMIAVVRSISLLVNVAGSNSYIGTSADAGIIFAFAPTVASGFASWNGRQVVNSSVTMHIFVPTGAVCDYRVSGYLLSVG